MLLSVARRSGLIVATGGRGNQPHFEFIHQEFRSFLAGVAIAGLADPSETIDQLKWRRLAEGALAAAAATDPERIPGRVLRCLTANSSDVFRMDFRLAAICLGGLSDLSGYEHMLKPVVDAVFAGAAEWWSRARFAPVMGMLRTEYTRGLLLDRLANDDPYERWAAVETLRYFADPSVVPALMERLSVESWSAIRDSIIRTIGRLREPSAIAALIQYYNENRDSDRFDETGAIGESLGRLGASAELYQLMDSDGANSSVIDLLIGAVPFVDEQLTRAIRKTFAQKGIAISAAGEVERYLRDLYDDRCTSDDQINAINGLAEIETDDVVKAVLHTLAFNREPAVRDRAAQVLAQFHDHSVFASAVHHIVDAMTSGGDDGSAATFAFLSIWNSPAQAQLAELFEPEENPLGVEGDEPQARAASAVLTALFGQLDVATVIELLDVPDQLAREAAVGAVGRFNIAEASQAVQNLATTATDTRIRAKCLSALARLRSPAALAIMTQSLHALDPFERMAAAEALVELGDRAASDMLVDRSQIETSPHVIVTLLGALTELWSDHPVPEAVQCAIIRQLGSTEEYIRVVAAIMIGDLRIAAAAPMLGRLMEYDPSADARDNHAATYGRVASVDALLSLADGLAAPGQHTESISAIASAIASRDAAVADALRSRVEAMGGVTLASSRAAIVRVGNHTSSFIAGDQGDPTDRASLLAAICSDDPAIRWDAVDELGEHWEEDGTLGQLALAMLDENVFVADRAAEIVSDLARDYQLNWLDEASDALVSSPENLSRLIDLLGDGGKRADAARWLLALPEFVGPLIDAFANGEMAVRPPLWDLAERYELRLLSDRRAVLSSGEIVACDDLAAILRSQPGDLV
jgi:HEAT repeat protein